MLAVVAKANMVAGKEKIQKEIKKQHQHHNNKSSSSSSSDDDDDDDDDGKEISSQPPKLHRDMTLICDAFRISNSSRCALQTFDASTLEDFCLMTDEDYAALIVTQARLGLSIPPLQQRKLRVLLSWVQSLAINTTSEQLRLEANKKNQHITGKGTTIAPSSINNNKSEGFELCDAKQPNECNDSLVVKAKYYQSTYESSFLMIPPDWEKKFFNDLPYLRKELQQMGQRQGQYSSTCNWWSSSNMVHEFLSLRWVLCGYDNK